jgi:hypothetical protein
VDLAARALEDHAEHAGSDAELFQARAVRRRFEERFTARRMAREYLAVYRSLIEFEALRSRGAVARASFR